jgi:hypothetical protein
MFKNERACTSKNNTLPNIDMNSSVLESQYSVREKVVLKIRFSYLNKLLLCQLFNQNRFFFFTSPLQIKQTCIKSPFQLRIEIFIQSYYILKSLVSLYCSRRSQHYALQIGLHRSHLGYDQQIYTLVFEMRSRF